MRLLASIVFLFLVAVSVHAARVQSYPDLGLKGAGVKIGLAIPDSPYHLGFAFAATGDLGKLHEIIGVQAALEFFRVTKTVQEVYTNAHSDISGVISLVLLPQTKNLPFQPYFGGGLGFHYLTDTPDETLRAYEPITHKTRLELHLLLGGRFDLTEGIDGIACFKVNLSDISTYNPYIGVVFDL